MADFGVKICASHSPYAQYGSFAMLAFAWNSTHNSPSHSLSLRRGIKL
jgi:hypothetical protein